jgi:DNA-binding transcriptional ArsR family regulator
MKPDPDYLKKLLSGFRAAPGPTTDIRELQQAGLDYEDPSFEFHLKLLGDDGYVERDSGRGGIGLDKGADGSCMWSVVPLRLTAAGQEFAEAIDNSKALETVKKLTGASLSTIKDVAVAVLKSEVAKHTGLHF